MAIETITQKFYPVLLDCRAYFAIVLATKVGNIGDIFHRTAEVLNIFAKLF